MKEEQLPAALQAKIIELETYKKEALSINSMSDVTLLAENIFIADITDEIEIKNVKRGMSHKMGLVRLLVVVPIDISQQRNMLTMPSLLKSIRNTLRICFH